jgi:iron complex outermembrane receptor protein
VNTHLPWRSIRNITLSLCALVFAVIAPARILSAQQPDAQASITGTVVDSKGSLVRDAAVIVKNETTGAVRKAKADSVGHFAVTGIASGRYSLTVIAEGFATVTEKDVVASETPADISVKLAIGIVAESVEVQADAIKSIASQHALSQASLEAGEPVSNISSEFIKEFTPPTTDYTEIIKIAPGVVSYNSNGVGLGQGTVYFRGFIDGDFDYEWDGIPEADTNTPSHHSWAFFPGPWIGGVSFDRSPGTASTIGPSTYGGSINLFSPEVPRDQSAAFNISYGSFNTLLLDGQYNSGLLGAHKNLSLTLDVHQLTSDGFETLNDIRRDAGDIKVVYNVSNRTTITGYSGVLHLFANTPNNAPYRAQIDTYGWNYLLQNNDPTSAFYQKYNRYVVPTDFEYVGVRSVQPHGWVIDVKPYTYSYNNAQYFANDAKADTTGLIAATPLTNGSNGWITDTLTHQYAGCSVAQYDAPAQYLAAQKKYIDPCAVDKVNSYRKYGEISTISQTSKYGVFRTGLWYEWSTTNRYQIPSDPLTRTDQNYPNFHEEYQINSYNPYAEYEWHATKKLSITAGFKYADYTFDLKQFADDGKKIGNLCPTMTSSAGCVPYVISTSNTGVSLPSVKGNYYLTPYWSAYGQFAKGDEIPPSSVFDVKGGGTSVTALPKPQLTTAYQGGTVLTRNRFTLDADYYVVRFQNNYIAQNTGNSDAAGYQLESYVLAPDSTTEGFEAETNVSLTHGFNVYANGTVDKATYRGAGVPSGLNVADTPSSTQTLAVTYQDRGLDLGIIENHIGSYYDDNSNGTAIGNNNGVYHNQVYITPTTNVNLFLNYTIRRHSFFDGSKVSFSVNNLFNVEHITDVAPAGTVTGNDALGYFGTTAPAPLDLVSLNSGRSFIVSFKLGVFPSRRRN